MPKAAVHNPYWESLGGGERYSAAFVKLLLDEGWQVDIWWPADISKSVKNRFGIDISAASFITPPKNYQLSTINYQLVFWVSDGSLPTSLAKKTIIHFQFPFLNIGGSSLKNRLKSRFYKFVVNSNFTKRFVDKEFGVDSLVIYPPVDVGSFKPGRKTETIIYVGRFSQLTQSKGQKYLVEAFVKCESRLPGWKLILAGNTDVGARKTDMDDLVNLAGGQAVKMMVNPSRDQLRRLYAQVKIFWSASGYGFDEEAQPLKVEHFGITVVEAMAAGGVPIITNLGGHKEIVKDGKNGYLWNNLDGLIDPTVKLANDPNLWRKLSQAAITSSRRFSADEFRVKFRQLI